MVPVAVEEVVVVAAGVVMVYIALAEQVELHRLMVQQVVLIIGLKILPTIMVVQVLAEMVAEMVAVLVVFLLYFVLWLTI